MATSKMLTEGWTLSCPLFKPILLEEPCDVISALRTDGLLHAQPRADLGVLWEQWPGLYPWSYETHFDAPEEDERVFLLFERLLGACEVFLNGKSVGKSTGGEAYMDVTAALCEGDNCLNVRFDPMPGGRQGIAGPVRLRTATYVTLKRVRFDESPRGLRASVALSAHVAGRFTFHYTLSLGIEAVDSFSYTERLRACDCTLSHDLPLASPVRFDPARPDETAYAVRLSIERSGLGCELVRGRVALSLGCAPRRLAVLNAPANDDQLHLLSDLGVQALILPPEESVFPARSFEDFGLFSVEQPQSPELLPRTISLCREERMRALAGDQRYWPPGTPVWRVTGSDVPCADDVEALLGPNALGDAQRYTCIVRALQAEHLCAAALKMRSQGLPMALEDVFESQPAYSSPALVEFDGQKRPAFHALRSAWANTAAGVILPNELWALAGSLLRAPIWLFMEDTPRMPVTVSADCFAQDGTLVASVSFAAFSDARICPGELTVNLPEQPCVLLFRTSVTDSEGHLLCKSDALLCARTPEDPPLGVLLNLPRAQLFRENGVLRNTGNFAALAVGAADFYGALLPGEAISLPPDESFECLNSALPL